MNCYFCHDAPGPGGTHLGETAAAGICKSCGVGVCHRHGQRSAHNGFLLCPDCRRAELRTVDETREPVTTRSA